LYRGIARYLTNDQTLGFGAQFDSLRYLSVGHPFSIPLPRGHVLVPMPFVLMVVIAIGAMILLNQTIYGRYLLALGRNEQAARYSGINTDRITMMAYLICSVLAGLGGVLFALDVNSIQPASLGEFYELYAIAAAVLGGCSLRGGEGTILGVIIGAAVILTVQSPLVTPDFALRDTIIVLAGVVLGGMNRPIPATLGGFAIGFATGLLGGALPTNQSQYIPSFVFGAVILVLLVRPGGLFTRGRAVERV